MFLCSEGVTDVSTSHETQWVINVAMEPNKNIIITMYLYGSMSGPPARTVGWRDPGFIHTSFLKDLWPNLL